MADAEGPAGAARTVWLGVVSLCLVQFIDALGVTVMVTALPAMLSDLHASPDAASLISTGYAMFFGGLLMFGARLGDRFGHRRIIFTGLAIFAVAAVAGATAPSVVVLTAARCLLGTGVPIAMRGTASGIINTAAQVGTAIGIAALLLLATLTTGIPEAGHPSRRLRGEPLR